MKKIIALLLVLALFPTSAFAFSSSTLSQYGMHFSDDDSRLVLRVEFVDDILKLLQIESQSSSSQVFRDVKETDNCYGTVMAAYDAGIVHGEPGLNFRPDEPVTYEEAIEIFVDILNYGSYIRAGESYQTVAGKIGLTKGIQYKTQKAYVNEKNMAKLFLNAIDIPMFELGYDKGHRVYTNGKTLLEKHDIHKGRGVVQAVDGVVLEPGTETKKAFVTIGTELFDANGENYDEYLGCGVDYLYRDDQGDYTLLTLELSAKTETETIPLYNIKNYQNRTLDYYADGRDEKIQLDSEVSILYNGAPVERMREELFLGDHGSVKLICNNSSSYDAVIITKYDDYFVDIVDVKNEIVYDKYNATEQGMKRSLDLSSLDEEKLVNGKGKSVEVGDISQYNVLSALVKENGELEKVIVSAETVEGTITEVQNTDCFVAIGATEYRGTEILFCNANLTTALSGKFYLNVGGMVAGVYIENRSGKKYGYIRGIDENTKEGCLEARILTCENKMQTFEIKKQFSLDGVRSKYTMAEFSGALSDSAGFLPQVIRYATDSEGKISYIDTLKQNKEGAYDSLKNSYPKTSGIRYRQTVSTFGNRLLIDANTILFRVPDETDPNVRGSFDVSRYRVITKSDLTANSQYTVAGYTSKENSLIPELIVNYSASDEVNPSGAVCVVTAVSEAMNVDNDTVPCIKYLSSDGEHEAVLESHDVVDRTITLNVGDLIRVHINSDGEIDALQYIYSINDTRDDSTAFQKSGVANSALDNHATFSLTKAHVYQKEDNVIALVRKVDIESEEELTLDKLAVYDASNAIIIVYDGSRSRNQVYLGNIMDIAENINGQLGDFVICYTNNSALKTIYVVK